MLVCSCSHARVLLLARGARVCVGLCVQVCACGSVIVCLCACGFVVRCASSSWVHSLLLIACMVCSFDRSWCVHVLVVRGSCGAIASLCARVLVGGVYMCPCAQVQHELCIEFV